MNSISEQTDFWKRKVGFYEIKWKIENFTFAFRDGSNSLETIIFRLTGKMITKWRFKLNLKPSNGEFQLILFIEMIPPASTPTNRVWTHWKVWVSCMIDGKEEEFFLEEFKHIFELGHIYQCRAIPIGELLLKHFKPFEKDIFTIRLLVLYNDIYNQPHYGLTPVPVGLLSLSNDLINKMNCNDSYDLKLKNNRMEIGVHKTILYYRNDVLRQKIDDDCFDGVINLEDKGGYELGSIVHYLYSGNFVRFIHEPTFAKLELVQYLNIEEINHWFVLDKCSIESKYDVTDFTLPWTINNYSNKTGVVGCIIYEKGKYRLPFKVRLSFYPKGFKTREYVSFYADEMKKPFPEVIFMQLSVSRGVFSSIYTRRLYRTDKEHGYDYGKKEFASKAFMSSCLVDDALTLTFQLKACFKSVWVTEFDYTNNMFPRTEVDFYKKLSLDMTRMLSEGKFSDFKLCIRDSERMVHECILSARSRIFAEKSGKSVAAMKEEHPQIFDTFIRYIYSGVLETSEIQDLKTIYDLASRYGMNILGKTCVHKLRKKITVETFRDVLDFATENDLVPLKMSVLDFCETENLKIQSGKDDVLVNKRFLDEKKD